MTGDASVDLGSEMYEESAAMDKGYLRVVDLAMGKRRQKKLPAESARCNAEDERGLKVAAKTMSRITTAPQPAAG